jgi:radical SAM family protein
MKVLLISPNMSRPPVMPIGMRYIADAVIRSGHQVACLDLCFEDPTRIEAVVSRRICEYSPDVIGISLRNLDVEDPDRLNRYNLANYNLTNYNIVNYNLATYSREAKCRPTNLECYDRTFEACKRNTDSLIILGGAAFTLIPKQFLTRYDGSVGIAGPGEQKFVRLLDAISKGEPIQSINGVVTAESPDSAFNGVTSEPLLSIPTLSEIQIPAYLTADSEYSIQSKRGCVYKCIHCSYPLIEGNRIRTHDPVEVATLMDSILQQGIKRFRFVDSVFNNPVSHAVAVCEQIARIARQPVEFIVNCSPKKFPRKLALALKESGCSKVIFGTDTASTKMLKAMKKPFTTEDIQRVTETCKSVGLYFEHHMLLGGPGETLDTANESLRFMDLLDCPVFVDLGIQVYENTTLARLLNAAPMSTEEFVPPIFIEPKVADKLPKLIIEYCSIRPQMHTFIVEGQKPLEVKMVLETGTYG